MMRRVRRMMIAVCTVRMVLLRQLLLLRLLVMRRELVRSTSVLLTT